MKFDLKEYAEKQNVHSHTYTNTDHESRKGKKWTIEEDTLLREIYKVSKNINDLMNGVVGRDENGIMHRPRRLANLETNDNYRGRSTQDYIDKLNKMHFEENLSAIEIGLKLNRTLQAISSKLFDLKNNPKKEEKVKLYILFINLIK